MQPGTIIGLPALLLGLALLSLPRTPAARDLDDHVDVTAVAVEGATVEECLARIRSVAEQSRALSLATSPPYDLSGGMRTFYDHVLRLDGNGELASTAQLSSVYVTGYSAAGERILRTVTPFIRVEVARPPGTPSGEPSRISISWLWLQRMAETTDPAGRVIQRPSLHRFDFTGELVTTYGTWDTAMAPCRLGLNGHWYGAVTVWTYLPR